MSGIFVNVGSLSRYGGRNGSLSRRLRPINPLTRATWLLFNNAGVLSPLVTATRSGTATFFDSTGTLQNAAANTPRVSYDPAVLSLGPFLLAEEARTNIVFPSDTLTTQTRTVTAVAHTLSFYGTGTVTLSGATTATVVGIGAFPQRRVFTFTPAAGNLTLTVSGSVTLAQLEVGSTASSYIPTTTAAVTRSADNLSVTNLGATGFNASEGTLYVEATSLVAAPSGHFASLSNAGTTEQLQIRRSAAGTSVLAQAVTASGASVGLANTPITIGQSFKAAFAAKAGDFSASVNGGAVSRSASPSAIPVVDRLLLGNGVGSHAIRQAAIIPQRVSDSALQRLTRI